MRKILVTGSPGSGKTTLSRKLGEKLGLPVYPLDLVYWKEGWARPDPQERDEGIRKIVSADAWVVDGVSERVFEAADTVIFLDVPRRVAYWRLLKRFVKYSFRKRPEVPDNSSELRILKKAIVVIWKFPTRHRPGILNSIECVKNTKETFVIRTRKDIDALTPAPPRVG